MLPLQTPCSRSLGHPPQDPGTVPLYGVCGEGWPPLSLRSHASASICVRDTRHFRRREPAEAGLRARWPKFAQQCSSVLASRNADSGAVKSNPPPRRMAHGSRVSSPPALAGEATGYVVIDPLTEAAVGFLMVCVNYWLETGPSFAHFVGRLTGSLGALIFLIASREIGHRDLQGHLREILQMGEMKRSARQLRAPPGSELLRPLRCAVPSLQPE